MAQGKGLAHPSTLREPLQPLDPKLPRRLGLLLRSCLLSSRQSLAGSNSSCRRPVCPPCLRNSRSSLWLPVSGLPQFCCAPCFRFALPSPLLCFLPRLDASSWPTKADLRVVLLVRLELEPALRPVRGGLPGQAAYSSQVVAAAPLSCGCSWPRAHRPGHFRPRLASWRRRASGTSSRSSLDGHATCPRRWCRPHPKFHAACSRCCGLPHCASTASCSRRWQLPRRRRTGASGSCRAH